MVLFFLALTGQAVSEEKMFEHYGDMHVYCPGVGAYEPLGSIFSESLYSVLLPISCKIFTLNDILRVFPIQMHW